MLSDQLYERLETVLKAHGLGHFSDQSEAEQITLLEEAHRELMLEENTVSGLLVNTLDQWTLRGLRVGSFAFARNRRLFPSSLSRYRARSRRAVAVPPSDSKRNKDFTLDL